MLYSTKPQTLARALTDSPVGLAAWLVEKYRAWSDSGGEVERRFTRDELLTHVMLYWVTGTIGSSIRLYYEDSRMPPAVQPSQRIGVPAGIALFRESPVPLPRSSVGRHLDVWHWTEMPRGGHFGAWEEPELFAEDVRAFFRPLRER